jgi:hypothetical protein
MTSSGQREVGASVLLNTYFHVHVGELILGGADPREANEACCDLYHFGALQSYLSNLDDSRWYMQKAARVVSPDDSPDPDGPLVLIPDTGPHQRWTTRCLTAALRRDQRLLATSWSALQAAHGPVPRARIGAEHIEQLLWQLEAMHILATGGGSLLAAARTAHDHARARPRRRRKPADPGWLAGQLDESLTAAWDALSAADDGHGRPFWKTPAPSRPRAMGGDGRWPKRAKRAG